MIANVNEKRRQTKLLAAIAILAMVVCAFAVVMPSEQTDGALPETEASGALTAAGISASYEIGSAGNYYIANTTSTVAITFDAELSEGTVNLYIATGTTITVAAHSGFTVHVIPAVAATTTPAAGATVQIYKGLDITAVAATYENTTDASNVSINVSSAVSAVNTATYGISDVFTNGGSTYYAKGSSISVDVSAGRTVTVQNGTATVSYGANTVVLDGVMDSDGVIAKVEGSALQISGSASTTGKISVTAGQVATSNLSFALNNMEAVTTSTISDGTADGVVLYAGIPQASEITSTLFIYKEVSAPISLTVGAQHTIYIRGNGDYSGTITQGSSSVEVEATQFSNNTNIVVSADNGFTLSGEVRSTTADRKTIVSDSSITVTDTNSDISVSNVALGTMTLINQVTVTSGSIVINDGAELTFAVSGDAQGKILLQSSTSLYIYGNVLRSEGVDNTTCVDVEDGASNVTIYGTNETLANAICGDIAAGNATFTLLSQVRYQANDITEFRAALQSNLGIEVTGTIVLDSNETLDITGKDILFTGGAGIVVSEYATLNITNSTLDQDMTTGSAIIVTHEYSQLNITESKIFMVVDVDELGGEEINNDNVTYENTSSDVKVGYGTNLDLSGRPTSDVEVYGTLTILSGSTVTLGEQYTMTVYPKGTLNVQGTLNVEGDLVFEFGSKGDLSGTVNVSNVNGGASFFSEGEVEVSGTMSVRASSSSAILDNNLHTFAGQDPTDGMFKGFTVTGTLNIDATFSGYILNKGTINFNGTTAFSDYQNYYVDSSVTTPSTTATIHMYDGVTMNVQSVTGWLAFYDSGVAENAYGTDGNLKANTMTSWGNQILINNVMGVTVSETVTSGSYTVDDTTYAYYVADMYISGTVSKISSAANGEIDFIGGNSDVNTSRTTTRAGGIHIAEGDALTLGDNVNLYNGSFPDSESGRANNQTFYVEGTLNVTGENASFSNTISQSGITAGRITVTGTVVIGPEATGNDNGGYFMSGTVNGTRYTLTTTENNVTTTTVYYASFDAAVQHIADSYNDTINVYGQQSVGTDVTIANGTTVSLDRSAILTVDEDITLTIATGGKVLGTQATIIVDGTMTAQNYREDITAGTIKADVIIDEAPARTWTTFAQALADAEPPATITLVQDITLTENTTIPEGITVNTRYKVNTDRYTLTVDGTLDVGVGGGINTDGITSDRDGDVVANGVVVMRSQGQSQANVDTLKAFDGAHFQLQSGATVSNYVTNLAYAAENVTSGTVTISGAVTGGEVVFTEAANATVPLVISVVTDRDFQDVDTVLSMTSITLNGAEFNVDGLSKVTGTIIVPCGDGTVNAEIELSRASGLFYVSSTSQVDATSTQYSAVLSGSVTDGTMTVAAGTVDIGTAGFTASSDFTVASGATLVLENTLTANDDDQGAAYVTIDGTIEIDGGAFDGDSIIINGTASYVDNASTGIVIYANGEIVVGEDATLTVNSKMVVGTPAASLGVGGAITGKYLIVNGSEGIGYILAYAGADLSGAQINWNTATQESDAQTTTYYINDVEYATVYANGGVNIDSVFGTADTQEEISLSGLVSDYNWYATPEDANDDSASAVTSAIGTEESVYNVFDPAKVSGVVTVGAGIDLFIDGVQVSGYGPGGGTSVGSNLDLSVGTHRVSYEIRAGWDGSSVSFTFNGQTIESGATITITADMTSFTLSATGATNSTGTSGGSTSGGDDGMGLTDYLLIVLVVLIVIMAIMVALRLMRS